MRHDSLTKIQQTSSVESLVIAWAEEVGGMKAGVERRRGCIGRRSAAFPEFGHVR